VTWRRRYAALAVVLLVLGVALVAALLTGAQQSSVTGGVENASSSGTSFLRDLSIALPLGYAFGAGMVAAVNPCGFALLPAYLGLYLGDQAEAEKRSRWSRLRRAFAISASVTLGFVLLFGITGLVLSSVTSSLTSVFPWLGLIVGVSLVLLAGRLMISDGIYSGLGERMAARVAGAARGRNVAGYFAYGVGYGLASLSCTLPIFLALAGGSLTAGRLVSSLSEYILYGLGMGAVITVLTLGTALFKAAAVQRVRRASRYVQPMSAVLLLVAGGYIVYYWLTLGGLLSSFS
jgi:cytochrome c biogenesis protein CcdA